MVLWFLVVDCFAALYFSVVLLCSDRLFADCWFSLCLLCGVLVTVDTQVWLVSVVRLGCLRDYFVCLLVSYVGCCNSVGVGGCECVYFGVLVWVYDVFVGWDTWCLCGLLAA